MSKTEWIISIDDDDKDYEELFVGNVRNGDMLIRCKDCVKGRNPILAGRSYKYCSLFGCFVNDDNYCSWAERKALSRARKKALQNETD